MRATTIKIALTAAAALGLASCVQSRLHLSDDYGRAMREDTLAQVADPDATYVGIPEAGAHGARVGLAQDRYVHGEVIQPASTSTSEVQTQGGAGGGGGSPNP